MQRWIPPRRWIHRNRRDEGAVAPTSDPAMGPRSGMTSTGGTPLPTDGFCWTHKVTPAGVAVYPACCPSDRHNTSPHQGGTGQHLSASPAGRATGLNSEAEGDFHPTCSICRTGNPQPNGNCCTELCSLLRAHQPPDDLNHHWNQARHPRICQSMCRCPENAAEMERKCSHHPTEAHQHSSMTCQCPLNDTSQKDGSVADHHTQPPQWHRPFGR